MSQPEPALVTHNGGCHCGRVRFEVDAPVVLELDACNCTVCVMSGIVHHVVPAERFRLTQGEDVLTNYTFGTGIARHPFCSVCGIKSFYHPRAYPNGVSVNANCLDPDTIESMAVTRRFDGLNWEEALQGDNYPPPSG